MPWKIPRFSKAFVVILGTIYQTTHAHCVSGSPFDFRQVFIALSVVDIFIPSSRTLFFSSRRSITLLIKSSDAIERRFPTMTAKEVCVLNRQSAYAMSSVMFVVAAFFVHGATKLLFGGTHPASIMATMSNPNVFLIFVCPF